MNVHTRLKIIMIVSVISFSIVSIISYLFDVLIGVLIGLIADVIQILSWVYWLSEKEKSFEEVPEKVDAILDVVSKKEERSKIREKLISRLVNEGAIEDNELYNLIWKKEIILAFPYGESVVKSVIALSDSDRQPLATLLEKLGFVKATRFQNVMVAFADDLPDELRNVNNLQAFLKSALRKEWFDLSEKVRKEYPPDKYKVRFAKWRSIGAFGAVYILMKSMVRNFGVTSINRQSFRPEFREHIWSVIDQAKLKKVIKKHRRRVGKIISKISIDFLLIDYPRRIRNLIAQNENELKNTFGIRAFTDYKTVNLDELSEALEKYLPQTKKNFAPKLASTIVQESKNCFDKLEEMGIYLA